MLRFLLLLSLLSLCFGSSRAAIQHYDFIVRATTVTRMCKTHDVITVNGQFPGPTIKARNGDTLVITVINYSQYNVTIHWHGIRQLRTGWADGPDMITQCAIRTGSSYTYRYTIIDQEGTLWWHAHTGWLRASVYGALVILPKEGASYPFLGPVEETEPIVLGEWWNVDPMEVLRQSLMTGAAPNISDAYTINSQPGDLYPCSSQDTYKLKLKRGKTYLLRIINAAMNQELFFKIAEHIMVVVGADALYTKPLHTDVIIIAPGQTTDVLIVANKPFKRYYMAARAYESAQNVPFDNTTTTAIIEYDDDDTRPKLLPTPSSPSNTPVMPAMPAYNDTATVTQFTTSLRSLGSPEWPTRVPTKLDESLVITVGLGMVTCPAEQAPSSCQGPAGNKFAASMNNVSFVRPQTLSLLQAHYLGVPGVFTQDFPARPPLQFDYTAPNVSTALWYTSTGTRVYPLRYGSSVQVVLQGTGIFRAESHPMHLHGYDFYIVGLGSGNYDPLLSPLTFNLIDPPMRNTVAVPPNGWAVIRFVADNPGVWIMHCHLDVHLAWGLAMAFVVDNGPHLLAKLEAPPLDLPLC